jgi:hypothetical protein
LECNDTRGKSTMAEMTLEQQRALAIAAARLRAQEAEQPQQRSLGQEALRQLGLGGRALYETFTAPATAVLEAGRGAYNLLAPESAQLPSFYAEQARGLSALGVPAPETMTERAVQAGAQGMAGVAGLARLAPNIPALSAGLSQQIPAAGVAGLTSQPVAEITKEYTGSDLAAALAGVGMGVLTAGGTAKTISALESGKQQLLSADQIRQRSAQAYQRLNQTGVTVKPLSVKNKIADIRQTLADERLIPGTDQAKEINNRLNQIDEIIGTSRVEFDKLEKVRGIVNDLRMSPDAELRRFGGIALREVDDYITSLSPKDLVAGQGNLGAAIKEVKAARKDWRNASRASVLEDALDVAAAKALDPKASESELIRRGFINIASNKKKMQLFSQQEQNIIKSVAKGGSLDNLLTFMAQFSPLRSKLAAAGGAYTFSQSPVLGASVAGGGLAADLAQGALRRRAAELATRQIASGVSRATPTSGVGPGLFTGILGPFETDKAGITAP